MSRIINTPKDKLLYEISEKSNDFTPKMIMDHINAGVLTVEDLIDIGIPQEVIDALPVFKQPDLTLGKVPEIIPEGFTEIYFWGIPGSGKTCALSGILSYAHKVGILNANPGNGFLYMHQLQNIFRKPIGFLPSPTITEVTQCLPFELNDDKGKRHPIALIELSGEIFRGYLYKEANLPFPDPNCETTYDTLAKFLGGPNKKVHFFVVDLSHDLAEKDNYGMCQDDYLNAAKIYFERNNIFKETTDAIYIVATKSDLLDGEENQREIKAAELLTDNYLAFVNVLKDACRRNRINDHNAIKVIPFSLGEVYFKYICKYDHRSSYNIVKLLQQITAKTPWRSGLMDFFN